MVPYDPVKDFDPATLPVTNPIDMTRSMTIAACDFTLMLRDPGRHLTRAKRMIERDHVIISRRTMPQKSGVPATGTLGSPLG
jgi:hypothetical protein